MKTSAQVLGLMLGLLWLAACGAPGAPQPPSLNLPKPVDDLAAARKGGSVYLTWTATRQTTDGQLIKRPGPVRVCRAVNDFPMATCAQSVAELPPVPAAASTAEQPQKRNFADRLPQELERQFPLGFAAYALEALNARGRSAGLSEQVRVPLAPTLSPPNDLKVQVTNEGVVLTFTAGGPPQQNAELHFLYRVYRRTEGTNLDALAGEVTLPSPATASLVDRNFEWEKTYFYWVTPITVLPSASGSGAATPAKKPAAASAAAQPAAEVEGDDSAMVKVFAHDIFPPATPAGVQAVFSGVGQQPFIDLTWAPNTESDLAGYHVYRHERGAEPVRINRELVKTPSFRDSEVAAGKTYFYAVSAVDLRGNESARSQEASESVP